MIKQFFINSVMFVCTFLFIILSCKKDEEEFNLIITTDSISNISYYSAQSGGNIVTEGNMNVEQRGVCWSTNPNPTVDENKTIDSSGVGKYKSILTDLSPNTLYYVRAYAISNQKLHYGQEISFISSAIEIEFSEIEKDSITTNAVYLSGSIIDESSLSIISTGICWSLTRNPIVQTDSIVTFDNEEYTAQITGLEANTDYFIRAYVMTNNDTLFGSLDSITTLPTLITTRIAYVAAKYAIGGGTLSTSLNGDAKITARGVCVSLLPNPTIDDKRTRNGTGTGTFYSPITSLQSDTLYYARAYATNAGGTVYGNEETFTTLITRKITFNLSMTSNPSSDQASAYKLITAAMDTAVRYYDIYTNWSKSLYVQYDPGVPTAQASNNGSIQFGSNRAYMKPHTAMHEISHTLGVGQNSTWWQLMVNHRWHGDSANYALRLISGIPTDSVHGDNMHFWPHGLNYESEGTSPTDLMNHCLIMEGMRKDGL